MKYKYKEINYPAVIKDLDVKKGIVEGYFNTWGIVDADGDELMPGSFLKTLQERGPKSPRPRIMHLNQHVPHMPLHRFTDPESLKEDSVGLWFRSKISQTSYGKDVLLLYEDEVINEHSVGIQIMKGGLADAGHQQVTEVVMWEGSTVTWGANMNTPTTAVKAMTPKEKGEHFTKQIGRITKALQNGTYTDETFFMLEIQLKQIEAQYMDLVNQPGEDPTGQPGEDPTDQKKVTVEIAI